MSAEILIIDDNSDIRFLISSLLKDRGFYIRQAANYNQALSEIDKKLPDVAIIDVKLDKGDNDGIELLIHIKKKDIDVPVIIISGHANIKMAVDSLKSGAFEFIQKPFDSQRLINFVNRAVENYGLKKENKNLQNKLFYSYDLIGRSPFIMKLKEQIIKLSLTESRIFIFGPPGSGKELVARKIHKNSNRAKKSLIILSGALLDPEKYEIELFGSENNDGTILYGALEKASNGILLIDEVSEIPLKTQAKILRVLTDQKFKRVNGNHDINVNVRIICTSNKDIGKEIENGNFREDLYHRLNVVPINLEPLKNRTEDIPLLIDYFSKIIPYSYGVPKFEIDINNPYLFEYDWPGNVRELRNLVERIAILSPNEKKENINMIINESLKKVSINKTDISEKNFSFPLKEARENFEKSYLTLQLKKFKGNISKTADFVGMERSALHRKLKTLGI
ncbi:MAG: sigma-54-dependent Fis family transcriptional regulator, partial [Pelagibacteraceae bacterium]|nr:sigma-54-dependent Fis family transcriptional regulator [Pelagibacteraceae bacterium]